MANFDWSSPVSSIGGSIVNAIASNVLANKQFEYSKQLAEQQNQYNIDMWRMNNEYNTPAAQMQRLQQAGLNPNLMYGQGSTGNASHAPQAVVASPPDYSGVMQSVSKLSEAINIAKQIQEYRALRLANDRRTLDNEYLADSLYSRTQYHTTKNENLSRKTELLQGQLLGYADAAGTPYVDTEGNPLYGYFSKLFKQKLEGVNLQNKLRISQTALNVLNAPYLRTRNAWQPYQYGVDMAGDVIGGLIGVRKMFAPGKKIIQNFNRQNNYYGY